LSHLRHQLDSERRVI